MIASMSSKVYLLVLVDEKEKCFVKIMAITTISSRLCQHNLKQYQ